MLIFNIDLDFHILRVMRHTTVALAVGLFLGKAPPPPNRATGRWAREEEDMPVKYPTKRCKVIEVSHLLNLS
jgi:hypothetical protein